MNKVVDNPYEQVVRDYEEIEAKYTFYNFLFGRIMHFLWLALPEDEKDLYLVIRRHMTLIELRKLLDSDWGNACRHGSDELIEQARIWQQTDKEKVQFI